MPKKTVVTNSADDTKFLAAKTAADLQSGDCLCLWGELGAGKTTFIQGLAAVFGIYRLTSPTYVLLSQYDLDPHFKIRTLYHFDLYRLEDVGELRSVNFEEVLSDPDGLVLIEWPDRLGERLPAKRLDITFKITSPNQREITFERHESTS